MRDFHDPHPRRYHRGSAGSGVEMKIIYRDYTKERTVSFRLGRLWFKPFHPYFRELADLDFYPAKITRRGFWKFYCREK